MNRNESYRLLGLKPGATEAEVRRQFKRMALKVHPDINPDPKANEQFIQLTKAMEILLKPESDYPFEQYTGRPARKSGPAETPGQREQRMKKARTRFEEQHKRKVRENTSYLIRLTTGRQWFLFRWITRLACLLALILILDTLLPSHYEKDELTAYSAMNHNGILFEKITLLELKNNGRYYGETNRPVWLTAYPDVVVEKTWILHTPVAFFSTDDLLSYRTGFDFHLGAIRWLLVGLLLIPLVTYLRRRRDLTFVFLYQLSFWGVGIVLVYILLSHQRLGHMLSAGFL